MDSHALNLTEQDPTLDARMSSNSADKPCSELSRSHDEGMDNQQNNHPCELSALQTLRDELRVKIHLAGEDVRDEFHRLEKKWERLDEELRRTARHTQEPAQVIGEKAKQIVSELQRSFATIRETLRDGVN